MKKFNGIDIIATDDTALQHVAGRLGLKFLPPDSSVVNNPPPASHILKQATIRQLITVKYLLKTKMQRRLFIPSRLMQLILYLR